MPPKRSIEDLLSSAAALEAKRSSCCNHKCICISRRPVTLFVSADKSAGSCRSPATSSGCRVYYIKDTDIPPFNRPVFKATDPEEEEYFDDAFGYDDDIAGEGFSIFKPTRVTSAKTGTEARITTGISDGKPSADEIDDIFGHDQSNSDSDSDSESDSSKDDRRRPVPSNSKPATDDIDAIFGGKDDDSDGSSDRDSPSDDSEGNDVVSFVSNLATDSETRQINKRKLPDSSLTTALTTKKQKASTVSNGDSSESSDDDSGSENDTRMKSVPAKPAVPASSKLESSDDSDDSDGSGAHEAVQKTKAQVPAVVGRDDDSSDSSDDDDEGLVKVAAKPAIEGGSKMPKNEEINDSESSDSDDSSDEEVKPKQTTASKIEQSSSDDDSDSSDSSDSGSDLDLGISRAKPNKGLRTQAASKGSDTRDDSSSSSDDSQADNQPPAVKLTQEAETFENSNDSRNSVSSGSDSNSDSGSDLELRSSSSSSSTATTETTDTSATTRDETAYQEGVQETTEDKECVPNVLASKDFRIFIGNLPDTTKESITELCSEVGNVWDVRISTDRATGVPTLPLCSFHAPSFSLSVPYCPPRPLRLGRSRGFCHVEFETVDQVQAAVAKLNGSDPLTFRIVYSFSCRRSLILEVACTRLLSRLLSRCHQRLVYPLCLCILSCLSPQHFWVCTQFHRKIPGNPSDVSSWAARCLCQWRAAKRQAAAKVARRKRRVRRGGQGLALPSNEGSVPGDQTAAFHMAQRAGKGEHEGVGQGGIGVEAGVGEDLVLVVEEGKVERGGEPAKVGG